MILLLTRKSAGYDSVTKTFYFNLDKQLEEKVKPFASRVLPFGPARQSQTTRTGVLPVPRRFRGTPTTTMTLTFSAAFTRWNTTRPTSCTNFFTRL